MNINKALNCLLLFIIFSITSGNTINNHLSRGGYFQNGLCSGESYEIQREIPNLNDCQHHCDCDRRCKYYSYTPDQELCHLFNSTNCNMNNLIQTIKWISGVSIRFFCSRIGKQTLPFYSRLNWDTNNAPHKRGKF